MTELFTKSLSIIAVRLNISAVANDQKRVSPEYLVSIDVDFLIREPRRYVKYYILYCAVLLLSEFKDILLPTQKNTQRHIMPTRG